MSLNNKNWIVKIRRTEIFEREISASNKEDAEELARMSSSIKHENARVEVMGIKEDTRGKEFPM